MSNVMSNVETFKYYASQLNLTKPQLEAVTDCFKACFEAGEGMTQAADKQPALTTPSEDRKKHASFKDNLPWAAETKDRFDLPSWMKNKKANVATVDPETQRRIMGYGQNTLDENFENTVNTEELRQSQEEEAARQRLEAKRRKIMERQKFLNRELGINLAIDGIWGKQSKAAYEEYLARKNGVKGKNRNPELARTAGPASSFDVTNVNTPLNQVAMGNRTPGQARTTGPAQQEITNVNSPLTNQVADRGMSRYGGQTRTSGPSRTPVSPNVDWKNQQTAYNVDFMDGVNAERPVAKATKQPTSANGASRYTYNAPQEPIGMTSRYKDLEEWSPLQDKMPY